MVGFSVASTAGIAMKVSDHFPEKASCVSVLAALGIGLKATSTSERADLIPGRHFGQLDLRLTQTARGSGELLPESLSRRFRGRQQLDAELRIASTVRRKPAKAGKLDAVPQSLLKIGLLSKGGHLSSTPPRTPGPASSEDFAVITATLRKPPVSRKPLRNLVMGEFRDRIEKFSRRIRGGSEDIDGFCQLGSPAVRGTIDNYWRNLDESRISHQTVR
jgi:hypothetical protein